MEIVVPTADQYAQALGAGETFSGLVIALTPFFQGLIGIPLNLGFDLFGIASWALRCQGRRQGLPGRVQTLSHYSAHRQPVLQREAESIRKVRLHPGSALQGRILSDCSATLSCAPRSYNTKACAMNHGTPCEHLQLPCFVSPQLRQALSQSESSESKAALAWAYSMDR